MSDIIIRLTMLPAKVNGVTVVDDNGDYNIYINSNLSGEALRRACKHELSHVAKNHHYEDGIIAVFEKEAQSAISLEDILADIL